MVKIFSIFVFLITNVSFANCLDSVKIQSDLRRENPLLEGSWTQNQSWKGKFCTDSYALNIYGQTTLSRILLKLTPENSVLIRANFTSPYAEIEGNYRGDFSVCRTVHTKLWGNADSLEVAAVLYFDEQTERIGVRVLETRLGQVRMARIIPVWVEKLTTNTLNRGFQKMWQSRLGEWINNKITTCVNNLGPQVELQSLAEQLLKQNY